MADRSVSVPMTLSDLDPDFKVTTFFKVKNVKKRCILGTKLLQNTNMVLPCLVTLTDL